jgi:N6-L-threonylcarbamoyladenine synthase
VKVLGIETSCDDTAAGVVGPDGILSDVVYGQLDHARYGGVVPELAGRAHAEKLVDTVRGALDGAGIERPDAVAATAGPGLMGAVLVGLCHGKALAAGWGVPFIGVNHLEGHLLSPLLDAPAGSVDWPFLCLVVSGGHTTLYLARGLGDYEVLAQTIDDAAGEAYDKVARMLGLGYPGGPVVDRLAAAGDPVAVPLPRPRVKALGELQRRGLSSRRGPLDMSFSGLKTAVRQYVLSQGAEGVSVPDVCASFQEAVVDVLVDRVCRAARQTGVRTLALGGGVAANSRLRERMLALGPELRVVLPARARCTDNAAMIAHVGRLRLLAGQRDPLSTAARAGWAPGTPPLHTEVQDG